MKDKFFNKTHYEYSYEFLNKAGGFKFFATLNLDPDSSYADFVVECLKHFSVEDNESQWVNFLNIFFHLYHMKQSGEKIYYITPNLSARLAQTSINIDSYFLKSPFREIFVQIDPGLFFINDVDSSKVPVEGFYIYFRDFGTYKQLRIIACSLLKPVPGIPFNDSIFYFHIEFSPGKLKDQLKKYIETEIKSKKDKLERFDIYKNIDYMEEFISFVLNVLLYITSKNTDLTSIIPIDYAQRTKSLKSASKIRKLEQRAQKSTTHKIIVIGAGIQDKNNDIEKIQKAGGVGIWKLNHKIRVSGHWRIQWYGSEKDNTQHAESIWIDDYNKGPEFSELISPKFVVK